MKHNIDEIHSLGLDFVRFGARLSEDLARVFLLDPLDRLLDRLEVVCNRSKPFVRFWSRLAAGIPECYIETVRSFAQTSKRSGKRSERSEKQS